MVLNDIRMKFIRAFLFIVLANFSHAQVGITKKSEIDIHEYAMLHLDGEDDKEYRGLLLPTVEQYNDLPKNNPEETDEEMTGLFFYDKNWNTPFVYTGEKWINEGRADYKADKARFYTNAIKDNQQYVACVLLLFCGNHEGLKFDMVDYDNLGIERSTATIKYGGINYYFPDAKFTVTQGGLYEIMVQVPTTVGNVVDLTSGIEYRLYYGYKDDSGEIIEEKISSFSPSSYGILGVGGGYSTAYTRVTLRMNPEDYIVAQIHSPGAGVSVVATLTAHTEGTEHNPREIIFTKISE